MMVYGGIAFSYFNTNLHSQAELGAEPRHQAELLHGDQQDGSDGPLRPRDLGPQATPEQHPSQTPAQASSGADGAEAIGACCGP